MIPSWVLYLAGFSLVVLGGLQIQQRPRRPGAGLYERFVNVGTLWSLLCITIGIGLLLMARGYWQGPLGLQRSSPPARVPRYH